MNDKKFINNQCGGKDGNVEGEERKGGRRTTRAQSWGVKQYGGQEEDINRSAPSPFLSNEAPELATYFDCRCFP